MVPGDHPTQTTGATIRATTTGTRGLTALGASLLLALPAPLARDAGRPAVEDEILELRKEIAARKGRLDSLEAVSLRGKIATKQAKLDSLVGEFAVSTKKFDWVGWTGGVMGLSGFLGSVFSSESSYDLGERISNYTMAAGGVLFLLFVILRHTAYDQIYDARDELNVLRRKLRETAEK